MGVMDRLVLSDAAWERMAETLVGAAMAVAGSGMMVQVTRSKCGTLGPAVKLSAPPAGRGT